MSSLALLLTLGLFTEVSQEVLTDSVVSSLGRAVVSESDGGRYDCVCVTRLDSATSRAGYLTVRGNY